MNPKRTHVHIAGSYKIAPDRYNWLLFLSGKGGEQTIRFVGSHADVARKCLELEGVK